MNMNRWLPASVVGGKARGRPRPDRENSDVLSSNRSSEAGCGARQAAQTIARDMEGKIPFRRQLCPRSGSYEVLTFTVTERQKTIGKKLSVKSFRRAVRVPTMCC